MKYVLMFTDNPDYDPKDRPFADEGDEADRAVEALRHDRGATAHLRALRVALVRQPEAGRGGPARGLLLHAGENGKHHGRRLGRHHDPKGRVGRCRGHRR